MWNTIIKKYKIQLICIVEIILLLSCLMNFFKPLSNYSYSGKELIAERAVFLENFIDGQENGFYFDDSMVEEGDDLQDYTISTPKFNIKKGSYEVKINYSTGTNVNTYTVNSDSNIYSLKIEMKNIGLQSNEKEHVFTIDPDVDVDGVSIDIKFSGDNYIFVNEVSVVETNVWKIQRLVIITGILALFNTVCLIYRRKKEWITSQNVSIVLILAGIVIFSSIPSFSPYLYYGHDLEFHLNRIEGLKNALLAGNFPVRMHYSSISGAGYPVSVFYGDLLLYVSAFLRLGGWSVQASYQAYVLLINIMTCLITYKVFKDVFEDKKMGMIGAFIYMMAPYRLECLYLRAAVGEYTALCFYPLVVYSIYRIYTDDVSKKENRNNWMYLTIAFSGLIYCHIISTYLAFLFVAIFCLINLKATFKKEIFLRLVKAVALTVGVCLSFLIPFLDYMQMDINVSGVYEGGWFSGRGITLTQLLSLFPHGSGASYQVFDEIKLMDEIGKMEMTYSIGIVFVLSFIIYVLCYINFKHIKDKYEKLGNVTFVFSVVILYMATIYFPWNRLEQLGDIFKFLTQSIQFPWRFLGAATVLIVFHLMVSLMKIQENVSKNIYSNIVIVLCVFSFISANYFLTDYTHKNEKMYVIDEKEVNTNIIGMKEYLLKGSPDTLNPNILHENELEIKNTERAEDVFLVECFNTSGKEQYMQIPVFCYKHYKAKDVNTNEEFEISVGEDNRIKIEVPQNYNGTIAVEFESPRYWHICEIISFLTIFGWIVIGAILYCRDSVWNNQK